MSHIRQFLALGITLSVAAPAVAVPVYEAGFETAEGYTVGGLGGQQSWVAPAGWNVISDSPLAGAQSAELTENTAVPAYQTFAAQSGDIYVGFQVRFTGFDGTDFVTVVLTEDEDDADGLGIAFRQNGIFARGVNSGSSSQYGTSVDYTTDTDAYVVLHVYKSGSSYDTVDVYLNPGLSLPVSPDASRTYNTGLAELGTILMRAGGSSNNFEAGDSFMIDSLVISSDLADVVIPEPASLALLGLGGLALVVRRRA